MLSYRLHGFSVSTTKQFNCCLLKEQTHNVFIKHLLECYIYCVCIQNRPSNNSGKAPQPSFFTLTENAL